MHIYKKSPVLFLVAIALFLVGSFISPVFKTKAATDITVTSAKITGAHQLTIVFNTGGQNLVAAPITAYGIADNGINALTLASDGVDPRTLVDTTSYPSATFTAVYTFDGAAATVNDTGSITLHNPTVVTDAGGDSFTGVTVLSVTDGQGQVPTVSSIVTGDINGVGTIDRLVLTFSEDISGTTNGTGFAVAGSSCTLGSASETTPGVMTFVLAGCTAGTAVLPTLTYTPGNLVDAATGLNSVGAFGPTSATDSADPMLNADNVLVDNSVQPNKVTLTFSEPLEITAAQTAGNYIVTNRDGLITYTIASAVLSPSNTVTLTLATVNPADNKTFITNYDIINNPITVIPSVSIIDAATPANSYSRGLVNDFGEGNLDGTPATVNATLVRTDATTYTVSFSEKVDLTTSQTLNKYTLGGTCLASTGNPSVAVLQANGVDVILTTPDTSGCSGGQTIIVTPTATITDVAGVAITSSAATNILALAPVTSASITGVTAPVTGATPVTTVTAGTGYTGTVSWSGSPTTFASATTYTATITLTATSGYTLTGVTENQFTIAGSTSDTNSASSGVITAVFPATAAAATHSSGGGYIPRAINLLALSGECKLGDLFSVVTGKPCPSSSVPPVTSPPIPMSCLIYGSTQELVKEKTRGINAKGVQKAINQIKAIIPSLVVDSIIGPLSEDGIINAQKILLVTVDGIWGPKTQQAYILFIKKQCSAL